MPLTTASGVVAIFIAGVLAFSLFGKVKNVRGFAGILQTTFGLRPVQAQFAAVGVPLLEATTIVALFLNPQFGLGIAAALFASFGMASAYAWATRGRGECGCFGATGEKVGGRMLLRTAGLLVVSLGGLLSTLEVEKVSAFEGLPVIAGLLATAMVVALLAFAASLRLRRATRQLD